MTSVRDLGALCSTVSIRWDGKDQRCVCTHLRVTVCVFGGEDKREGQATAVRQTDLLI